MKFSSSNVQSLLYYANVSIYTLTFCINLKISLSISLWWLFNHQKKARYRRFFQKRDMNIQLFLI